MPNHELNNGNTVNVPKWTKGRLTVLNPTRRTAGNEEMLSATKISFPKEVHTNYPVPNGQL